MATAMVSSGWTRADVFLPSTVHSHPTSCSCAIARLISTPRNLDSRSCSTTKPKDREREKLSFTKFLARVVGIRLFLGKSTVYLLVLATRFCQGFVFFGSLSVVMLLTISRQYSRPTAATPSSSLGEEDIEPESNILILLASKHHSLFRAIMFPGTWAIAPGEGGLWTALRRCGAFLLTTIQLTWAYNLDLASQGEQSYSHGDVESKF